MSGPLCRVCGTEQPEQAPASPAADDGSAARIAELTQAGLDGAEKLAALTIEFEALKTAFDATNARAEAAEAHAAEFEQLLTEPPAVPPAPPADPPATKADKPDPKAKPAKG